MQAAMAKGHAVVTAESQDQAGILHSNSAGLKRERACIDRCFAEREPKKDPAGISAARLSI